uniref:ribosomal protein S19 n=1 Tax=Gayralia brasiliensis TaxID=1286870 RepID=UPI00241112F5|nr:ribosomal protein S19 [Gayralia brasiliensis]YP_010733828.1 ribosomal protein S19 [Monostroma nitidum]WEG93070.1 ribosomal protein S19 [Gayralia brasiliensis]WEG93099.1 ribosomal protein S19 [Monostroma nitidum]
MTRSSYKLPYVARSLNSNYGISQNNFKLLQPTLIYQRSSTILPKMIGKTVKIHSGQKFVNYLITSYVIGYKFGEFAPTKKRARFKKKKNR